MNKIVFVFIITLLSSFAFSQNFNDVDNLLTKFEEKFDLKFHYNTMPKTTWPLTYQFAELSDSAILYYYLKLFEEEFDKYPLSFIKKTNLKTIVFVKSLAISGQNRAAIPDYYNEILLYDFRNGYLFKTYQQHVIHHEYYHMIEEEFNNDAYFKDPEWLNLNVDSVEYGTGGAAMYGMVDVYSYIHPQPGFVNLYSTASIEEDKAEIFATLFIKSESDSLNNFTAEDEYLLKKKNYMMNFLHKQDKSFTDDYWNNLHPEKKAIKED